MSSPREGTARALVYAQLAKAGKNEVSAAELARAAHGKHNRAAIDQALAKGVRCGDVVKVAYGRYKLASNDSATRPAVPPPWREERAAQRWWRGADAIARQGVRRAA